jgi:hypothetical protein
MSGSGRTVISGASGPDPTATLAITTNGFPILDGGRTLDNEGTTTLSGSGNYLSSGGGTVIENSGTFEINSDADLLYSGTSPRTRFENESSGVLKKSLGGTTSEIQAFVDNDGSVEVASGTLDLPFGTDPNTPDTSAGDFVAALGATLRFVGSHRLSWRHARHRHLGRLHPERGRQLHDPQMRGCQLPQRRVHHSPAYEPRAGPGLSGPLQCHKRHPRLRRQPDGRRQPHPDREPEISGLRRDHYALRTAHQDC